ncbi:hypothetical protein Q1695_002425 [Nippostrongylus brasiliensis]|nr:hypothetical protein Q1695_002425 [Nippostrongylus brasiliensis]
MADIYDMTRRATMHGMEADVKAKLDQMIEEEEGQIQKNVSIIQTGQVCKRWRSVACSPLLWKFVSFRPNYGGIQVVNHEYFLQLIGTRFTELRYVELATDLITPSVLYEMSNKCPRLQHLTLGKFLTEY